MRWSSLQATSGMRINSNALGFSKIDLDHPENLFPVCLQSAPLSEIKHNSQCRSASGASGG